MPTANAHASQVAHLERFFRDPNILTTYPDHAMVAVFYAALHCLDAWLTFKPPPPGLPPPPTPLPPPLTHQTHPANHWERKLALEHWANSGDLPWNVYKAYKRLKNLSEDARYRCRRFGTAEVLAAEANHLKTVRAFVNAQLGHLGSSVTV